MKGNDIKTLEQLHKRALALGIDRYIIPDEMDIMWVRLDEDGKEAWQFMVDRVLEPKGCMRVYGMHTDAVVAQLLNGRKYHIGVLDAKNKLLFNSEVLEDLDDVRDFLLIYFKGLDGIHDFGEVRND